MRVSNLQLFQQNVGVMQRQSAAITRIQQQIASGQRIQSPSDDPAGAKRVLDLQRAIDSSVRHQGNADLVAERLGFEDTTLRGAANALQRVRELVLQGGNATLNDSDRRAIALEVQGRLDELVGIGNTRAGNGEYLFAGTASQSQPVVAV